MRRVILLLILSQFSLVHYAQIIADHNVVDQYDKIPQQYIDEIKKMWLVVPGASHAWAYVGGLQLVEYADPKYQVNIASAGTPHPYTITNLRASKATWGNYANVTGWMYDNSEEDWWTNTTAISRVKAGITYCNSNNLAIAAIGFGVSYEMVANSPTVGIDPVYGVHWSGNSINGPDGDIPWGIDAEDYSITHNSISMDTYISVTQEYIDFCIANSFPTKVFFTTGPVDEYSTEARYQAFLKYEHLRDYVKADPTRIFFDYADILCYDNNGIPTTDIWNGHVFPTITEMNWHPIVTGHISEAGCFRLGKAMWWMLARIAGWDGSTGGPDTTPPTIPAGLNVNSASVSSISISWSASSDNTGVTGYRIFRGGIFIGTSTTLNYTDNTATTCNPYIYTVSALDAAGNESTQSNSLPASKTPSVPLANLTHPTCSILTGIIQLTSPIAPGIEYSINSGATWNSNTTFSVLTANTTYNIRVRNTNTDPACISNGNFTINPIPASPSAPTVSNAAPANICPAGSVNLTSLVSSTTPTGGSILYKAADNPLSLNVPNPAAVGAGNYYIFYQNQLGCYSTGTLVSVSITACSAPDITPTLIVNPNIMHGPTSFNVTVKITELNIVNTSGSITVIIPKDSRWTLPDGYNPLLTIIGSTPLNNNAWSYSSDATNHIFTSSTVIASGGYSTFGFRINFNPGSTNGIYTIAAQVVSGGGGEVKVTNNVDSERIDYFQQ